MVLKLWTYVVVLSSRVYAPVKTSSEPFPFSSLAFLTR
jgi:hypothetical protein